MYYIYALVDPINDVPFYIGKGKDRRAWAHLKLGKNDSTNKKKNAMIQNIRMLGFEPRIDIFVESLEDEDYAYKLEYQLIKVAKHFGISLTNRIGVDLRPPSRKGIRDSEETRLKKSLANKRRVFGPLSVEHKEKLSKALKGKSKKERTFEHKRNIGISKAKSFDITFPDGHVERIFNMRQFCITHNLDQGHLHSTTTGKRNHHKRFVANLVNI